MQRVLFSLFRYNICFALIVGIKIQFSQKLFLPMASEEENYYEVLGVDPASATAKSINRAYRLAALKVHPDKNPDNPEAEAAFLALSRAYEVLSDPDKKQKYDALFTARLERLKREAEMNAKRREMASDLLERERAGKREKTMDLEEARRARLEVERLRMEGMSRIREEERRMMERDREIARDAAKPVLDSVDPIDRTIKLKWSKKNLELNESEIKMILEESLLHSKQGSIETVLMKKNGLALICFCNIVDAVSQVCGLIFTE